jgi:hypothetical protein
MTAGSVDIESPDLTKKESVDLREGTDGFHLSESISVYPGRCGHRRRNPQLDSEEWVSLVLGSKNPFGVVLATLIGVRRMPYIFGSIPIAEALLYKGAQLGTVLSFMMAVTTLSLPSMIMLRKAVKPKLLALFVLICTVGIILVGYFFNLIQPFIL